MKNRALTVGEGLDALRNRPVCAFGCWVGTVLALAHCPSMEGVELVDTQLLR